MLGDAEFGDNSTLRDGAGIAPGLPYAVGVSSTLGVFVGTPTLARPPRVAGRRGRPRTPTDAADRRRTRSRCATLVAAWPARAWRAITWRNAPTARAWTRAIRRAARHARACVAQRRLAPEVWLLAERDLGATPRTKYYLVASARDRLASRARPARASTLGDRTAVSRTQGRARPRSLRRALAAGVAAACRRSPPSPTPSCKSNGNAVPGARPDAAARPRHPPGSPDRALLRHAAALPYSACSSFSRSSLRI